MLPKTALSRFPFSVNSDVVLLKADKIARVGNQEKECLKTMLLVKLRNKNIEKYFNSVNAHEILDRISF